MNVVISGASGKTGFRIAEESLKSRHQVRLITRETSVIPESLSKCEKTSFSFSDTKTLDNALRGNDALFIATGARPSIDLTGPARIDACGVRAQIESCNRVGINRVILVSSLCVGKFLHPLNLFGLILLWKKIGEDSLINSSIKWTIVRPGGLTEKEDNLNSEGIVYSKEGIQEEGSIPRRLVARCCVEALSTPSSEGKIIEITSRPNQEAKSLEDGISAFMR